MSRNPLKEEIYEWIKKNIKAPISVRQLAKKMGISHHTALRWVDVLSTEGKIKVSNFGNIKLVYPVKEMSRKNKTEHEGG